MTTEDDETAEARQSRGPVVPLSVQEETSCKRRKCQVEAFPEEASSFADFADVESNATGPSPPPLSPSSKPASATGACSFASSVLPGERRRLESEEDLDNSAAVQARENDDADGLLLLESGLGSATDFASLTFETDAALIESLLASSSIAPEVGNLLDSSHTNAVETVTSSSPSRDANEASASPFPSTPTHPSRTASDLPSPAASSSSAGSPSPSPLSSSSFSCASRSPSSSSSSSASAAAAPPSGSSSVAALPALSAESLLALAPTHATQIEQREERISVLSKEEIRASVPPLFSPPTVPEVQNVVASARVTWSSAALDANWKQEVKLDLRHLAISCRFAEYNPRKINACIVRLRNPKCTVLVFRSGRLIITGARSDTEAERAARLTARMLTFAYCGGSAKAPSLENQPALALPACSENGTSDISERCGESTVCPAGPNSESLVLLEAEKNKRTKKLCLRDFKIENVVASADCGVPVRLEGLAFEHKEFSSYEPELFSGLVYRYNPTASLKAVLLVFVSGKVVITGCKSLSEVNHVFESLYPVLVRYHQ
ncbi:TATA-box binding protein TBP2 [Toxoplasma gondii GT1]|uniref:TATA-box binding protein TBP2 n=2 Tax=Toxoplasma gondii TaxID=5811 RepID=S7UZ25_TOXGG|nr:TATA-box binding protein TBP2 [Toxoplasma gondii GT1]KAF4641327.1 TATA-box binding protein TBP2 [Toxoplasma gondii]